MFCPLLRSAYAVLLVASMAACGGGGGGASVVANATVAPAASPVPAPVTQTTVVGSANPTLTLPANAGFGGTLSLSGSVPSGTNATITTAFAPSPGVASPTDGSADVYTWLSLTSDVTLTQQPSATFNLPTSLVSQTARKPEAVTVFALEFFDPTKPTSGFTHIATCETLGAQVICTGIVLQVTLKAGVTYVIALVEISVQAAPSPTATASPSTQGLVVTPPAISLLALGATTAITASESHYTGQFGAGSADTNIVTVTTSDFRTFRVTAINAGITSIVVSDSVGRSTSISVAVTVTNVPVN